MPVRRRVLLAVLPGVVAGCAGLPGFNDRGDASNPALGGVEQMGDLQLTSPAFDPGGTIPDRFGKAYENQNPPLSIDGVPEESTTLAFVVDDPDAPGGTFTHWLAWNIPPDVDDIPAGWTPPEAVRQGRNDFGNIGYDGPKPPSEHTYRFKLFALGIRLELPRGSTQPELGEAMSGSILGQTQLTGTFAP